MGEPRRGQLYSREDLDRQINLCKDVDHMVFATQGVIAEARELLAIVDERLGNALIGRRAYDPEPLTAEAIEAFRK